MYELFCTVADTIYRTWLSYIYIISYNLLPWSTTIAIISTYIVPLLSTTTFNYNFYVGLVFACVQGEKYVHRYAFLLVSYMLMVVLLNRAWIDNSLKSLLIVFANVSKTFNNALIVHIVVKLRLSFLKTEPALVCEIRNETKKAA